MEDEEEEDLRVRAGREQPFAELEYCPHGLGLSW
jgi:hypothetical protein